MPNYLHRTSKEYLVSVSPVSLLEPAANYIMDPDLSAVAGQPSRYWIIAGDLVTLMDQTARDAVDAAEVTSRNDVLASVLAVDDPEVIRAFAEVVLDEINVLRSQHSLNARTLAQLKTAVRGKL